MSRLTTDFHARNRSYVYVIWSECGRAKIGTTDNPSARVSTLARQSPYPLDFIALMMCKRGLGWFFEERLHELFKSRRVHGEWFDLTLEEIHKAFHVGPIIMQVGNLVLEPAICTCKACIERVQAYIRENPGPCDCCPAWHRERMMLRDPDTGNVPGEE
jgi:hypothetical protein